MVALCSEARDVVIAAPYIKYGALTRILGGLRAGATLTVITRWTPHDLATGVSDAECRSITAAREGSFRLHSTIHAKYYRVGDAVLVGSANVTSAAMGWSRWSNTEILCGPAADFDSRGFERRLVRQSRELSDHEFEYWQRIGQNVCEGQVRGVAMGSRDISDWRPATRELRNLELAYRGRMDDIASYDEQRAATQDLAVLALVPNLGTAEFGAWVSTSLLSAPFTQAVIDMSGVAPAESHVLLAARYGLSVTQARRDFETVQNWLATIAPVSRGGDRGIVE